MRWVCDCEVTLQYYVVDGWLINTQLENLQYNQIGPVIGVTVISGKLEEIHLPHYICLRHSDPSLKDAVKALSIKDEGRYEEPMQLTRFNAKIVQPSFSLKTVILRWLMHWDEHCNLLMYIKNIKRIKILSFYMSTVFPFDDRLKSDVEKKEIEHPRPDRPFRMNAPHFLNVPHACVHPKEGIMLRRNNTPYHNIRFFS